MPGIRRNLSAVVAALHARWADLRGEPNASPPAPPTSGGPLDPVNDDFHALYGEARARASYDAPVFVILGDELIVLRKGERCASSFAPRAFHIIKSVAHAPVSLFVLFEGDAPPSRTQLRSLMQRIESASAGALDEPDLSSSRADLDLVLRACLELLDTALAVGAPSPSQREAFAARVGPSLLRLASEATKLQLSALHEQTERVLADLSPAERAALHVVVAGDHQARVRSLAMQYFRKRLNEPATAERRVTYAEAVRSEQEAFALVGTQRLDRAIARAFFGESTRLQRDILGDAAEQLLRSFPSGASITGSG